VNGGLIQAGYSFLPFRTELALRMQIDEPLEYFVVIRYSETALPIEVLAQLTAGLCKLSVGMLGQVVLELGAAANFEALFQPVGPILALAGFV